MRPIFIRYSSFFSSPTCGFFSFSAFWQYVLLIKLLVAGREQLAGLISHETFIGGLASRLRWSLRTAIFFFLLHSNMSVAENLFSPFHLTRHVHQKRFLWTSVSLSKLLGRDIHFLLNSPSLPNFFRIRSKTLPKVQKCKSRFPEELTAWRLVQFFGKRTLAHIFSRSP